MIKDITVRRLNDISVKGNFTIHCETEADAILIRSVFKTTGDNIRFKDIKDNPEVDSSTLPLNMKFFIRFESLNELLKLRETFRARGSKFDMYLIRKRKYNPFENDFYKHCADPVVHKVIT